MNFNVIKDEYHKEIKVPTSKSYANRLLILAATFKGDVTIQGLPESSDVKYMLDCLKKIGLSIKENPQENSVLINNSFPECESEKSESVELETGDGGTTNRFLVALLARGKKEYRIHSIGHMQNRPMGELLRILSAHKVTTHFPGKNCWLSLQGPFQVAKKVIAVDSSETTQFATGLALSFWDHDIKIELENAESSWKYFDITLNLIEDFKKNKVFRIPVDFSSLSYPLAAAFTRGDVLIENCFERDFDQADSALLDILTEIGGNIAWTAKGLRLSSLKKYAPIIRDCSDFPDLVPTLVYLAAYAAGESQLKKIKVLRHKESDRIEQCLKLLELFAVEHHYDETEDILFIQGRLPINESKVFVAPDDHRIVMVSYLFLKMNGGGEIRNSQHVKKSFPNFFAVME